MSISQILEHFVSVKIDTLAEMISPVMSSDELESKVARLITEGQLVGFRIDNEYIVRENHELDMGEIAIKVLNNVVTNSESVL